MKRWRIKTLLLFLVILPLFAAKGFTTDMKPNDKVPPQEINRKLIGSWENQSTKSIVTIEESEGTLVVVSEIDDDGEVFVILESKWENGTFKWAYKVPSTGYVVNNEITDVTDNTMKGHWSNPSSSGEHDYIRVNR